MVNCDGQFWADRIKHFLNEPNKRLQIALENLPLPRAFREASMAIRAIIRSKRKSGESHKEELNILYWLAAWNSFMLPYANRLKEPGFNVIASIPKKLLQSLPVDYHKLGYEKLELLNKTDKKWLVELWGYPDTHTTFNQIYRHIWDEYEDKLIRQRQAERNVFMDDIQRLLNH
jgi:hypothetical protein